MISRSVETFDLYLTSVLKEIFLAQPKMMMADGNVELSIILEAGDYDTLIGRIVDKKVHDVSYKSLNDLRKYILSRTGIDLFVNSAVFNTVLLATEVRNVIAHNDCVVSEVFLSRTQEVPIGLPVSDTGRLAITPDWITEVNQTLDGLVFRFDELVGQKFDVRQLYRFGAFLYRG